MTHPLPLWPWPPDDPRRFKRYLTERDLPTGMDEAGRKLCAWCPSPLPKGRRRYCSDACSTEAGYRLQPRTAERRVGERDGWRCGKCGRRLFAEPETARIVEQAIAESWLRSRDYRHGTPNWLALWERRDRIERALRRGARGSAVYYELDHILPISEGGGGCGLEGFRLLCLRPCHAKETGKLRRRLNARKREAIQPVLFSEPSP